MAGHFLWVLVWTGACYWHGVGGFMFNSSSSPYPTWELNGPGKLPLLQTDLIRPGPCRSVFIRLGHLIRPGSLTDLENCHFGARILSDLELIRPYHRDMPAGGTSPSVGFLVGLILSFSARERVAQHARQVRVQSTRAGRVHRRTGPQRACALQGQKGRRSCRCRRCRRQVPPLLPCPNIDRYIGYGR